VSTPERNPELPDPARPSREGVRETLIERKIREAMDEGVFDGLPHQGTRLPLDDDSSAGEWAMAYRMLRNAGAAPPWIESDKAVRALLEERDRLFARAPRLGPHSVARARQELERIVAATNRAIEARQRRGAHGPATPASSRSGCRAGSIRRGRP
jgi:hypothetical protein